MDKIKILIVDDHPVFRDGLYDVLETIENFIIVGAVGDGEQAIEMALQLHPDVIIMDINLPTINGIQATRKIKAQLADVKVVIITGYDDKEQVFHALRAGASAYCPKDITPEILADAIDTVCRGNYYIVEKPFTYNELLNWIEQNVGQFSNSLITNESKVIPLSPREMEILHAVTYGFSNKEIASKLGISHQTVKNHLNAILRKLNVSDRIQASVYALRQGWVALQGKANGDNKKNLLASDSNDDSSILLNSTTAMWIHRINNLLSASVLELNNILSLIDKDQEKARLHLNKMKTRLAEEVKSIRESDNLTLIVKDTDNSSSPVSVNKIVQEFIEDYQFSISDIGNKTDFSKLALNLEPNLPDAVSNENILKDIIRVLVDNAFRAIKPIPDGKILIETKFMDEKIIIDISDNGIGMPGYIAENLFKSPISNPDGGGLGLGLLLTAKLVKYWDGDISLLRSNDSGSVIRISLLKWPNTNTNINTSASLARALVVDDNIMWQEAISQQLASRGLSVDVAGNENTTMSLLKDHSYDLALLDLRLSTWDVSSQAGINIARSVRERNPEALIVILTGYGSFESVREAFRLGVDDFLDKAEFIEKGLNKIDRLIDQLAVQRETQRESFRQSQINKYIYEILAMFSHELRSPLLTILRNAEALNVGALGNMTPKQNEATATILSAVKREFTLLNAHLDLNRIEQGAEQFKYQDYDLVSLVREEVHAHEQEAMRKKVRLQTSLTQKKANVRIDVNRFRIAINPLMDNAIKFSSEDGIVLIRARVGIDSVEIQITDQGPGMQSDEIEHLLNLRPNESKQFSPRIRGSGLGLSMAKRIIEMHNGKLWIESDGKNGTTVIFRLPIK